MPRSTVEATLSRRRQVEALELRGVGVLAIAKQLGADVRTIRRDVAALATERTRTTDLAGERLRLLAAAKEVEVASWGIYSALPTSDAAGRLGALGKALAAQQRAADVLGALAAASIEQRLSALEAEHSTEPLDLQRRSPWRA